MRTLNKSTQGLIAGFTLLGLSAAVQAANGSADFTLDGAQVTAANISIETGVEKNLRYNGGDSTCTDVEWYLRKPGETDWGEAFDSDQVATLEKLFRSGTYELNLTLVP